MAISRTPIIDDDGSGTTGTVLDNAWKQELYDQIDAAAGGAAILTSTQTGTVNDWLIPGRTGNSFLTWNGAADLTVTGIGGVGTGDQLTISNTSTSRALWFVHFSPASTAPNQFVNSATSGLTPVGPGGSVRFINYGGAWVLVAHEQGAWIVPPFNAAHFTGNAAAWTVASGNILCLRYRLSGRTVTVNVFVASSTVAAGNTALQIANGQWGGFTSVGVVYQDAAANYSEAGTGGSGILRVNPSSTQILCHKNLMLPAWIATSGTTQISGSLSFEVA